MTYDEALQALERAQGITRIYRYDLSIHDEFIQAIGVFKRMKKKISMLGEKGNLMDVVNDIRGIAEDKSFSLLQQKALTEISNDLICVFRDFEQLFFDCELIAKKEMP